MWTIEYKTGWYIQGNFTDTEVTLLHSPSGYGYEYKERCKSLHAAKCIATRMINARS